MKLHVFSLHLFGDLLLPYQPTLGRILSHGSYKGISVEDKGLSQARQYFEQPDLAEGVLADSRTVGTR